MDLTKRLEALEVDKKSKNEIISFQKEEICQIKRRLNKLELIVKQNNINLDLISVRNNINSIVLLLGINLNIITFKEIKENKNGELVYHNKLTDSICEILRKLSSLSTVSVIKRKRVTEYKQDESKKIYKIIVICGILSIFSECY